MSHTYYLTRHLPYSLAEHIIEASKTWAISLVAVDMVAFDELSDQEKQSISTREDCKMLFRVEGAQDIDAASCVLDEMLEEAAQQNG